jgi:Aldehyde dehydrogenase family
MEVAIPGAANGIFFNQGQCCNAGSRLYIEPEVYDEVVQGISDEAGKIKVGEGLAPDRPGHHTEDVPRRRSAGSSRDRHARAGHDRPRPPLRLRANARSSSGAGVGAARVATPAFRPTALAAAPSGCPVAQEHDAGAKGLALD